MARCGSARMPCSIADHRRDPQYDRCVRAAWLIAVIALGCSKRDHVGGGDPEAPLRELIVAARTGDVNAIRHALVSADRLRKALDCPTDELFTELEGAHEEIGEAAELLAQAKPKVELGELVRTSTTKLAKGDPFRGCTAREPFEVRAYSFELTLEALGHTEKTTERGDVIQLDGRWYALLGP